ncbi:MULTISPECIES: OmpA family protein [Nitrincola]|uniref:Inner membrane lipoprotein YiaD n=1 Tax=Nitrincola nitratireducens TaxID=1229521 RepID=W9V1W7_9GAMM|nr:MULTISPECIES: OmpA family protein [Nitrincola]EXJ10941.1 Inner membrane lipoprotein YiaD precursor [Nitrincola nitratireducens]
MELNLKKAIFIGLACYVLAGCSSNPSQQTPQNVETEQVQTTDVLDSVVDALMTSPHLELKQTDDETLLIEFPSIQAFSFDGSRLSHELQAALVDVSQALMHIPNLRVNVIGHTDNLGNAEYNQVLSENRAKQVADFLRQQGFNPMFLTTAGYGPAHPIADNRTAKGRAANRRVELMVSF